MDQPIIFAALNYRLHGESFRPSRDVWGVVLIFASAFGFLGGKEVKEAGISNLGLHDRELSLVFSLPTYTEPSDSSSRTRRSQMGQEVHFCVWR